MQSSPWIECKPVIKSLIMKLDDLRKQVDLKVAMTDGVYVKGISYASKRVVLWKAFFNEKEYALVRNRKLLMNFEMVMGGLTEPH